MLLQVRLNEAEPPFAVKFKEDLSTESCTSCPDCVTATETLRDVPDIVKDALREDADEFLLAVTVIVWLLLPEDGATVSQEASEGLDTVHWQFADTDISCDCPSASSSTLGVTLIYSLLTCGLSPPLSGESLPPPPHDMRLKGRVTNIRRKNMFFIF